MELEEALDAVTSWFTEFGAASLKLPSRWFGRPFDNLHRLTFGAVIGGRLVLGFDAHLLLILAYPTSAKREGSSFVLEGFHHGLLDWDEYGTSVPHLEPFAGGRIEFHSVAARS